MLTVLAKGLRAAPARTALYIFQQFIRLEAAGGILLLAFAGLAMLWANLANSEGYFALWQTPVTVGVGGWALSKPLLLWINDGLMAIFFFVVGLEIKREILAGELSTRSRAALPLVAAVGGALIPALIFVLLNAGGEGSGGWGIPMATDIAFTLGVLALLGNRVPLALKVFVTALAIVDDLIAVLVIALFYTADLSTTSLAIGGVLLLAAFVLNRIGVAQSWPYMVLGVGLWLAFLYSGVHATIAGVLLALTIPARQTKSVAEQESQVRAALDRFTADCGNLSQGDVVQLQAAIQALGDASEAAETPLQRLEHVLHPWVVYLIMPLFAFANAGVTLVGSDLLASLTAPLSLGIILGLVVGKPLGITLAAFLAVRLGLAALPEGVRWGQMVGVSCLAGIGFTMSIFITSLAFDSAALVDTAKIGIIAASLLAGGVGWVLLRRNGQPVTNPAASGA